MENIAFCARKKITMDKFISQLKITTNSSINKVLNVLAKSDVTSCDCVNGYVSLSGKIMVNAIYLNSENLIEHSEMVFDFIEKQQINLNLDDIFANDNIELKNVNFSGSEIICIFEHNINLNGNYKYEFPIFSDESNQIVTKQSKLESLKFVTSCSDDFVVAEETEVNIAGLNVISSDATVILYETNCLVDKVMAEGKIIVNTTYSDGQGINSLSKEFDFKQEIAAEGVVPNMIMTALSKVKNVSVSSQENENKSLLTYSIDLYLKGLIYEQNSFELVDDMFSLKNNISTTYDYVDAKTYSSIKNYSDTFMLSTDISNIENFDDILGVYAPKFYIDTVEELEEKSILTGTITSNALYKVEESLSVLKTSLPVKIEIPRENFESVGNINALPEITSFKVKAGKYLEVVYVLNYEVSFEKSISAKFVKSFEVKSEKVDNVAGIKLYITSQGETLFDVAKKLNVKPETITSQNEVLESFEQGEKIYIYSPINLYN